MSFTSETTREHEFYWEVIGDCSVRNRVTTFTVAQRKLSTRLRILGRCLQMLECSVVAEADRVQNNR
jgi:hypothetical protein